MLANTVHHTFDGSEILLFLNVRLKYINTGTDSQQSVQEGSSSMTLMTEQGTMQKKSL